MGISTTEKIKEGGGECGFRGVMEGLAEKVVSEQRCEGGRGRSLEALWAEYPASTEWGGEDSS